MTNLFAPAIESDTRFRSRSVHKTIAAYVEEKVTELGWVDAPRNFGLTVPVTFEEIQPDVNGKEIVAQTVAVTVGDGSTDVLQQMGGGLYEVVYPFFIDVYGQNASIATSLADDIKEQFTRENQIPLYDWKRATAPVLTSSVIEFGNVTGPETPPVAAQATDFKRFWRIVKAEARVYYAPTE